MVYIVELDKHLVFLESSHLLAVSSQLRSNFEDIYEESRRDKKHLASISTWIEII